MRLFFSFLIVLPPHLRPRVTEQLLLSMDCGAVEEESVEKLICHGIFPLHQSNMTRFFMPPICSGANSSQIFGAQLFAHEPTARFE